MKVGPGAASAPPRHPASQGAAQPGGGGSRRAGPPPAVPRPGGSMPRHVGHSGPCHPRSRDRCDSRGRNAASGPHLGRPPCTHTCPDLTPADAVRAWERVSQHAGPAELGARRCSQEGAGGRAGQVAEETSPFRAEASSRRPRAQGAPWARARPPHLLDSPSPDASTWQTPPTRAWVLPLPREAGQHPTGPGRSSGLSPPGHKHLGLGIWPGRSGRPPPGGARGLCSGPAQGLAVGGQVLSPPRNRAAQAGPRAGGQGPDSGQCGKCHTSAHRPTDTEGPPGHWAVMSTTLWSHRWPVPEPPGAQGAGCPPRDSLRSLHPSLPPGSPVPPQPGPHGSGRDGCKATRQARDQEEQRNDKQVGREPHAQMWGGERRPAQPPGCVSRSDPAAWTSAD